MKTRNGFTLIELLVVITIIGVLSMIGLTSFKGANQKARDSRRAADVQQIRAALEMFKTDNDVYPPDLGSAMNSYFAEGKVPTDPKEKQPYTYVGLPAGCSSTNTCSGYSITFNLEAPAAADADTVTINNP